MCIIKFLDANVNILSGNNVLWNIATTLIFVILWIYSIFLFFTCARNTSNFKTGNLIYIRPYALSVLVQPSDGEVGKELPVQPQLIFVDKQVTCSQVTLFL